MPDFAMGLAVDGKQKCCAQCRRQQLDLSGDIVWRHRLARRRLLGNKDALALSPTDRRTGNEGAPMAQYAPHPAHVFRLRKIGSTCGERRDKGILKQVFGLIRASGVASRFVEKLFELFALHLSPHQENGGRRRRMRQAS